MDNWLDAMKRLRQNESEANERERRKAAAEAFSSSMFVTVVGGTAAAVLGLLIANWLNIN